MMFAIVLLVVIFYFLIIFSMVLLLCEVWILLIPVFVSSVWANHGDDISLQYSGTGALKGDFVRYFSMDLL